MADAVLEEFVSLGNGDINGGLGDGDHGGGGNNGDDGGNDACLDLRLVAHDSQPPQSDLILTLLLTNPISLLWLSAVTRPGSVRRPPRVEKIYNGTCIISGNNASWGDMVCGSVVISVDQIRKYGLELLEGPKNEETIFEREKRHNSIVLKKGNRTVLFNSTQYA
jgi:hypothetical protein